MISFRTDCYLKAATSVELRNWTIAAMALTLPVSMGCKPEAPAVADEPVPKVSVMEVSQQETIDYDEYIGQTEASEIVEVRARVFGYLKTIEFKDGDFVKEGQLLFTIEPDEYAAIHEQSVSRVALNEANLELRISKRKRDENLVKKGAVSVEEYEESVAAAKAAEAAIVAAKADANRTAIDLKYTEIKAPISGRIDRAFVTKGNLLTGGQGSGTLLTKIVKEQPMYVYFDVDERSLLRYMRKRSSTRESAPGSLRELKIPCSIQLADEQDFQHHGQLDFVASTITTSTGTARLRAVFANEKRDLASGNFVRVRIPVSEPYSALLIPERALATDQSIKFVFVVGSDGTAERRAVELGAQRGEMRIVTKGLQAGERVIVKGLQRVRPGQKVEAELMPAAPVANSATAKDSTSKKSSIPEESSTPEKSSTPENPTTQPENSKQNGPDKGRTPASKDAPVKVEPSAEERK
jgi:RND family efflux transporter MFP subunit